MWILLLSAAAAAPSVLAIGDPIDLDLPGRHARPFQDADGSWHLGFGRSGSFHAVPLDPVAGTIGLDAQRTLVRLDDGIDHGFVVCPDGGALHVASRHGAARDDSAVATRLEADGAVRGQRAVVTDSTTLLTNDMAVVCGDGLEAAAFAQRGVKGEGGDEGDTLFLLDADFFAGVDAPAVDVSESTRVTGNAMRWEPDPGRLLIFGMERDIGLRVAEFDASLAFTGHHDSPETPPAPFVGWWAQGAAQVGDHTLLVHMMADPATPWNLDTGDVGLVVLGPDLAPVAHHRLTTLPPPDGAMRPALAVAGTTALVTFDVGGAVHLVQVELELDDGGEDGDGADGSDGDGDGDGDAADGSDGASADAGTPAGDTGARASGATEPSCGCGGAAAGGLAVVGLLGWRRRR